MLINERLYPIVGTVTMDQIMVDIGDDVIFWSDTPQDSLQCTKVAERIGTDLL